MLHSRHSWRDRAEEYRAFAEAAKDTQVRAGYLQLAQHCESLAERQELAEKAREVSSEGNATSKDFG